MIYEISKKNKTLKGTIRLPASKSISNRVLIIQFLSLKKFKIKNLSTSSDTQILKKLLSKIKISNRKFQTVNAEDGGTTFRFLTALLSITEGKWKLTGTERMKKRPVGILVDSLKRLGADIEYVNKNNFPPLKIIGKKIEGKIITINSSVSSQYVSALLLIAPRIKNGLTLHLKGKTSSAPYIKMTLKLMNYFGIKYAWRKNTIKIDEQKYVLKPFVVESDWSSASYFYEMAAFAQKADLKLIGLKKNSLQGDMIIADWMRKFGVKTQFNENGVRLTRIKLKSKIPNLKYDFKDSPDLTQTMMVLSAGLKINSTATGVESLKIKETNRIIALKNEFKKIGTVCVYKNKKISLVPDIISKRINWRFRTYNDHRMAMAFTALALSGEKIQIENPEVVKKSFPEFWKEIKKIGFEIKEI